jgi:hypothetical protein
VSQAKETASLIKNSLFFIIKDSGHSVAIDQPATYRALVKYFINLRSSIGDISPIDFLTAAMAQAGLANDFIKLP